MASKSAVEPTTVPGKLRLSGPGIGNTYPVKNVSNLLLCVAGLLESAYRVLAEDEGLPPRWTKHQIRVLAGFPEKGSIIFPIDPHLAVAATIASQITPQQVFDLAKQALGLFMKIPELFKNDKTRPDKQPISVKVEGDNNTVTINCGDAKITTNRQAASVMARSHRELKDLPNELNVDDVELMELEGGIGESLRISASAQAKVLTFPKPLRDEIVAQLTKRQRNQAILTIRSLTSRVNETDELDGSGDIIAFDKEKRTGVIRLVTATGISPGDYSFEIRSREASQNFINAMLLSRVRVRFFAKLGRKSVSLSITWIEKELGTGA